MRVDSPAPEQLVAVALHSFRQAYEDARIGRSPGIALGPEALEQLVATIRCRELPEQGLRHLQGFALSLGARRALDYAWYLRDFHPDLAALKRRQAWHLGHAHAAAVKRQWERMVDDLGHLAELERTIEAALTAFSARGVDR